MMMRRYVSTLFVSLFLLTVSSIGFGQSAQIQGRIADSTEAVIPNAVVRVVDQQTGTERKVMSNGNGRYSVPGIDPGTYKVFVQATGFSAAASSPITLNVAQNAVLDFKLQVGSGSEEVTVNASDIAINTTDATVSTVVDRQFVENLPLNGRSFQPLITIAPGVNLTTGQNYGDLGEFSVNGQRPTTNYFSVDGVSANIGSTSGLGDPGMGETLSAAGGTNSMVSVDALQEFRILTSSFAPEFGRTPGGQVILQTRSGTDTFHGTLFEYFRNDVFDANDWFANRAGAPRAALRFNDFGGTFGGPILKNNTFFFFSYEQQVLRQPGFGITPVPDMAARQAAPPAVGALLDAFPTPNGPELGNGLAQASGGYSNPISAKTPSLRMDHNFSQKLSAFARYSYSPSVNQTRGASLAFDLKNAYRSQSTTVGLSHQVTPKITNETRANWSQNRLTELGIPENFGGGVAPSTLFPSPLTPQNTAAYIYVTPTLYTIDGARVSSREDQINLTDNLTYSAGAHNFKFGVDYLYLLPTKYEGAHIKYVFSTVQAAIDNNFTCNCVSEGNFKMAATNLSFFAQDTWRFSPRLTVTYGLRWDINPTPHSRLENNGNYLPLLGDYTTGDVYLGKPGSQPWNTQFDNLAPRVGVAYQFRQKPKWETVLRGGAGLFYDIGSTTGAIDVFGGSYPALQVYAYPNLSFPATAEQLAPPPINLSDPPAGTGFTMYPQNLKSPRVWQFNLSVQQSLGEAQSLTMSWVGALGRSLLYEQYFPSVGPQAYGVEYTDNSANSNYQSLQVQFQRNLAHGPTGLASYTWAHSLDDSSSDDLVDLPPGTILSPRNNWGASDFDVRQSFKAAFSWDVPSPSRLRWMHAIVGGWGTDGLVIARSATPVDIGSYSLSVFGSSYYVRPNVVPGQPFYLYGSQYAGGRVFNSAAFVPSTGVQGELQRNTLRGFNLVQADLSFRRAFTLTERMKLLFRGDLFNILNHPNFSNPDGGLGDGTFGESLSMANNSLGGTLGSGQNAVFQTGGPRTVQFSLKFEF